MKSPLRLFILFLFLFSGCATQSPLNLTAVDSDADPGRVAGDVESFRGRTVNWGGLVVSRSDEGDRPLLQILSYPLRYTGNPEENTRPTGLFLFRYNGDKALGSYLPGRFVTMVGEIVELASGAAGQTLPLVQGSQIYLWGNSYHNDYSRTTFGFGAGRHF